MNSFDVKDTFDRVSREKRAISNGVKLPVNKQAEVFSWVCLRAEKFAKGCEVQPDMK